MHFPFYFYSKRQCAGTERSSEKTWLRSRTIHAEHDFEPVRATALLALEFVGRVGVAAFTVVNILARGGTRRETLRRALHSSSTQKHRVTLRVRTRAPGGALMRA